ncbi:MAG TPA: molybdopterin dinucleotide binding domain-containing protein [Chitinophagaceae bacterium]|nr:molybdopterin dinucleotide binding domain-containing protein [Chitinophagaceae bacterium]
MGYAQTAYDPRTLLNEISQIVPFFAGVRWDELGPNGKQWPVLPDGRDTEILHTESFKTGKGQFKKATWKESVELTEHKKDFPFILTTNRELEHYNCGTMTRRTGNATILPVDTLMIHPEDAAQYGIAQGDMVCVESARGKIDVQARISDEVKPGILSSTFHYPEVSMNILTSSVTDTDALCPEYKVCAVRIRKSKGKYKTSPLLPS